MNPSQFYFVIEITDF